MNRIVKPNPPPVENVASLKALILQKDRQILQLMEKIEELQNELDRNRVRIDLD